MQDHNPGILLQTLQSIQSAPLSKIKNIGAGSQLGHFASNTAIHSINFHSFFFSIFSWFFLFRKYSNTATYSTCNFFKAAATFIQLFSSMRFANTYLSFLLFSLYESCSILFLLAWKNSSFNCKFTFIRFSQ